MQSGNKSLPGPVLSQGLNDVQYMNCSKIILWNAMCVYGQWIKETGKYTREVYSLSISIFVCMALKYYPKQWRFIVELTFRELDQYINVSCEGNPFQIIFCEMTPVIFKLQCVEIRHYVIIMFKAISPIFGDMSPFIWVTVQVPIWRSSTPRWNLGVAIFRDVAVTWLGHSPVAPFTNMV